VITPDEDLAQPAVTQAAIAERFAVPAADGDQDDDGGYAFAQPGDQVEPARPRHVFVINIETPQPLTQAQKDLLIAAVRRVRLAPKKSRVTARRPGRKAREQRRKRSG
jgi:hypothetical protein